MRTIKFRYFDKDEQIFRYIDLNDGGEVFVPREFSHTLQQFTGLLDINRKEIYENDIVKQPDIFDLCDECDECDLEYEEHPLVEKGKIGVVKYSETYGKYVVSILGEKSIDLCDFKGEIIGNIYENPDLLTNN